MPELHLIQPGFTYRAYGTFTKLRERIQKTRETDNWKDLFKNELDKTCFAHAAVYADSKDLAMRTMQRFF